jgi:hypothetical protein
LIPKEEMEATTKAAQEDSELKRLDKMSAISPTLSTITSEFLGSSS